jgi:hypothetical protein
VLQAWSNLARTAREAPLVELMRRHAPSWLAQLPGLVPEEDVGALQRWAHGTTRERMVREMAELIEAVSAERTLVLVLEDLHWSDRSTLDLVAYLAERRDPARVLLIGTYRAADMRRDHPSRAVTRELLTRRRAEEVRLEPLAAHDVGDYLRVRLGGPVDDALPSQVHRRTEGHPLFVVTLTDWALREGLLREADGRWALSGDSTALDSSTPESLRQAIERQIEALDTGEQRLLETASIVGGEFSVAAVAAALETEPDALEERFSSSPPPGWRSGRTARWPDATASATRSISTCSPSGSARPAACACIVASRSERRRPSAPAPRRSPASSPPTSQPPAIPPVPWRTMRWRVTTRSGGTPTTRRSST